MIDSSGSAQAGLEIQLELELGPEDELGLELVTREMLPTLRAGWFRASSRRKADVVRGTDLTRRFGAGG